MTNQKLISSFKNAFYGIFKVIQGHRNIKIQIFVAAVAILIGILLHIALQEWIIILLCVAMVLAAEIFNTALETMLNQLHPDRDTQIGLAKDMAAGAVLVLSIASFIIGLIIFIPKIIELL